MIKPRTVKNRLNFRQRIAVIVMDVMLLAELVFCMRYASRTPELMTEQFLRLYAPMLIVTVVTARLAMRFMRDDATPGPDAGAASCDNA